MAKLDGKRWLRIAAYILGVVLVAAAVVFAGRDVLHAHRESKVDMGEAIRHVWPMVLGLVGATLANLFFTAAMFWIITRSFDAMPQVRFWQMWDLICAAALLNYLPAPRAGLVGRVAYLKLRHGLPVRQSVIITVTASVLFVIAAGGVVAAGVWQCRWPWLPPAVGAGILVGATMLTGPVGKIILRRQLQAAWMWLPLRVADLLSVVARLWFAFAIIGQRISIKQVVVLAMVDFVTSSLPLTPNGLGLSEWAMRLIQGPVGQAAKLIDRAISIIVLLPLAIWSIYRLGPLKNPSASRPGDE